jgi:hypothetical protein
MGSASPNTTGFGSGLGLHHEARTGFVDHNRADTSGVLVDRSRTGGGETIAVKQGRQYYQSGTDHFYHIIIDDIIHSSAKSVFPALSRSTCPFDHFHCPCGWLPSSIIYFLRTIKSARARRAFYPTAYENRPAFSSSSWSSHQMASLDA